MSEAPADAQDRGRALERAGDLEGAFSLYTSAGLLDDAVRMLLDRGRFTDAADVILSFVTTRPRPLGEADRAWALRCAELFEQGGAVLRAVDVLAWVGAAAEGEAVAKRLLEAGQSFAAGSCLVRVGDPSRGIELVVASVPRGGQRYGAACVEVARGLSRSAAMTMDVDRWLADFIRRGPDDEEEAEALYAIAAAFAREGLPENAVECLRNLEARRPGFRDAAAQAARLEAGVRGAVQDFARVLDEDARFLGVQPPASGRPAPIGSPTLITRDPATEAATAMAESFAPGVVLAKRYRLEELIGRGGMSLVYRATDLELQDSVALKIFTQPTNEDALARFKQEVLLARQLIHRHVVRVYDLGTALGARFLTMELLLGEDMHTKLTHGLSLRDGIDYLIQACAGLEAAHQVGVIHRDVKPENLFITRENVLKVTDFGIAKATFQKGLTVAGMVVGTPEYMAPEQAHGHMEVTPRADLYSIGVILYFLCTRTLPFRHSELVPLLMMHVNDPPEAPRLRNPALHADVEQLVLELLAKDPAARPASARALGERLIELRLRGVV
ncbi:MAG: serine/threonine protein kinase [Deltaproteobacteria bacterium]|nr:serine/threonine protein kinase [Deltaproteobacteria bacterium]